MTRDDLDLVDEYVLGLIDGADRDAFELRLEEEPDLRAAVARSRDRFILLAPGYSRSTASSIVGNTPRSRATQAIRPCS